MHADECLSWDRVIIQIRQVIVRTFGLEGEVFLHGGHGPACLDVPLGTRVNGRDPILSSVVDTRRFEDHSTVVRERQAHGQGQSMAVTRRVNPERRGAPTPQKLLVEGPETKVPEDLDLFDARESVVIERHFRRIGLLRENGKGVGRLLSKLENGLAPRHVVRRSHGEDLGERLLEADVGDGDVGVAVVTFGAAPAVTVISACFARLVSLSRPAAVISACLATVISACLARLAATPATIISACLAGLAATAAPPVRTVAHAMTETVVTMTKTVVI
mmetsp:Transcript_9033/g.16287  ORF Transcript_9033/g.16287 Transcript_9033/m.16287 type:complete len:275 (+) Transcript_9033:718-1542(+)